MPQKNPHQWKLRFFNYKIPSTDAKARTASVQGVILYTVSLGSAVQQISLITLILLGFYPQNQKLG